MELIIGVVFIIINFFILLLYKARTEKKLQGQLIELKTNEQYYQSLYQHYPDMVLTFDLEGNFLSANKVVELYGYTEGELLHQTFTPFVVPTLLDKTTENFNIACKGTSTNHDTSIYSKDGVQYDINVTNIPIFVDNQIVGVYAIVKDITELKKTQKDLAEAESLYRNLAEDSLVGIYIIRNERVEYVNQKTSEMLGYSKEEIIGMNVMDLVYPDDHELVSENMKKRQQENVSSVHYQYRALKKNGTICFMEVHGSKTIYKGKPAIQGTIIDITARKTAEQTIKYMAYHDSLTGLSNRNHFYENIKTTLVQDSTKSLALLFCDLDRFQMINDSMGHGIGDRLLQEVADRLKSCMTNQGELARSGGDEFLVSLLNLSHEDVSFAAQRILDCFTKPFLIDQYEIYTTPSIGISLYPNDGKDVETLVKKADSAMYQAKRNGTNRYQFYYSKQIEKISKKFEVEMHLRRAWEQKEFNLHYQPKLDLATGKIIGVEALIRWQHPEKGIIAPEDFIPLAEETGLIIPMGEWVLRTACLQNKAWQEAGLPSMVMSVNLSVRQLYQPNLVEMIRKVLIETALAPKYLELEITESMLMDTEHGLKVLTKLKEIGIQISLDDFGTGYSSLHYLKDFPLDKLKIDQSFVRNCTKDNHDATIVKTIIAMAHQLKLKVVAEGVELKEHLVFLQRNLCNEAQGYLFCKALPPEELVTEFGEIEQIIIQNGVPQELSNIKWMEEALQIARQDLLDTVRQQQGMIFKYIEENGTFIHTLCDGELLNRMGFIPEQIIGNQLSDFLPAYVVEEKISYYRRAWEGEDRVTYESEVNGIHYVASLRPIRKGGKVVEVIGSCVDITERKQVEDTLRLSEYKYRLITNNMSDLIRVLDVNGKVIYASPSHETVLGYSPKIYEGNLIFQMIHPDDVSRAKKQFHHMISTKKQSQFEFRIKHANGEWVFVESKGSPIIGEDEEVEQIIVVARDISERKKADEFIQKTEKLSVVGQLAAGVAHEIRNPLTSIKGFLQMMQKENDHPHYFEVMLSEIDGIEKIVKEFLSLAKPQTSKMSSTDITVLLYKVVSLIGTQTIIKNIEMIQEMDEKLPYIYCDDQQMKQVFINILQNAVEAMSNGGTIKIQVTRHGTENIRFRFIDQGCGIPENRMKSIGEPFYSTKEKGTGLGLMISHKIVKEHGGILNIKSIVNRGTTVEVILPIEQTVTVTEV